MSDDNLDTSLNLVVAILSSSSQYCSSIKNGDCKDISQTSNRTINELLDKCIELASHSSEI